MPRVSNHRAIGCAIMIRPNLKILQQPAVHVRLHQMNRVRREQADRGKDEPGQRQQA